MRSKFLILLVLTIGLLLSPASVFSADQEPYVTAKLIANIKAIVPGRPFKLGVELIMQPGWHTYYKEPGDAGMPTKIKWQLPPQFSTNNDLYWQKPLHFDEAGIITYGYKDKTLIATEILPTPKNKALRADKYNFSASVQWLSCKDACIPGKADVHLTLPVVSPPKALTLNLADHTDEFATANISNFDNRKPEELAQPKSVDKTQILTYFFFALIGGFLLNFMPCVLPVVAIKILSLLEQTDKNQTRKTAIAFSVGILSSFLLLGLTVVGLQRAGQNIGWGFQFQQPIFLMIMSAIVLIFALSLFGMFDFSFSAGQKTVNNLADKEGIMGDFFKGVLATVLSTPCTAPFLGTALGFAFVESWIITLTIFAAIGLGMCLPYLILIFAPQYLKFLPKPGHWMTKLKEAFGFILLATVAWLISILYYQVSTNLVVSFIYLLLSIAFAIWLLHSFTNLASSQKRLLIVRSLSLLIVAISVYLFIYTNKDFFSTKNNTKAFPTSSNKEETGSFNIKILNDALNSNKIVFLDFTAKWCLTCQLNENMVINTKEIQDKFKSLDVHFIKIDWTKQDPTVTNLLREFDRSGVPLYVIYPSKNRNKPIVLPELITKEMVLNKLDEAGAGLP